MILFLAHVVDIIIWQVNLEYTFFTADIWICHSRKSTGVPHNINSALLCSSVPVMNLFELEAAAMSM